MNRYNFGNGIVDKAWERVCNTMDKWADKVESTISKWINWLFNLFGRKSKEKEKTGKIVKMTQSKTANALAA